MEIISFKTSFFGGFNRKEVIAFIEKQNKKSAQNEKILSDEIEALKNERDESIYKLASLENQLTEIKKEIDHEHYECLNAIKAKEQLESEFRNYKVNYTRHDKDNSDVIEKARRYDVSKQMIADTLLQAQKDANILIEKAKIKSQQLSAQVHTNFDNLLSRLSIFKSSFGLISSDIYSVSSEFKQISDLIISISNEASKVDESILNLSNSTNDIEYVNNRAFDLDAIITEKMQGEQNNIQMNNQEPVFENKYQSSRDYIFNNNSEITDNPFIKEEPVAKEQYIRYEEPIARDQYIRYDEPVARDQYARYEEPVARDQYVKYEDRYVAKDAPHKQYDSEYRPSVSNDEIIRKSYDNAGTATENKAVNEQANIFPINDLPHKKKVVNISDILMKYSK